MPLPPLGGRLVDPSDTTPLIKRARFDTRRCLFTDR